MRSPELVRYAGISYRQVDNWVRVGYLVPDNADHAGQGKGRERNFSRTEADKARLMGCLITVGFEVWQAAKVASLFVNGDATQFFLGHGVTVHVEKHTH